MLRNDNYKCLVHKADNKIRENEILKILVFIFQSDHICKSVRSRESTITTSQFLFSWVAKKVIARIIINMINIDIPWINHFILTQLKTKSWSFIAIHLLIIHKIKFYITLLIQMIVISWNIWILGEKPYFLRNQIWKISTLWENKLM